MNFTSLLKIVEQMIPAQVSIPLNFPKFELTLGTLGKFDVSIPPISIVLTKQA